MSFYIRKVISGLQTGADQGGLAAAWRLGVATGGCAPAGFKTEDGLRPDLGERYGLTETPTDDYVGRTRRNAFEGDGTIRFAIDWNSPGEKLTFATCKALNKPVFDVSLRLEQYDAELLKQSHEFKTNNSLRLDAAFGPHIEPNHTPFEVCGWVWLHNIRTLNIAGNRESAIKNRSIERFVTDFMEQVLEQLREA